MKRLKLRLKALRCLESLAEFVKESWPILNPERKLTWRWYHDAICEHLEALYSGLFSKLMVWTPPGTTKTTIGSVCFPAWGWAKDPILRWLIGTNADDLAMRDSMACRLLISSEWYQQSFCMDEEGNYIWALSEDQNAKGWYTNTKTGHRQALTTAKTVTGKKGDFLIIDDPHSVSKVASKAYRDAVIRWYREEFYNRVSDFKKPKRAVIGQRTDLEDLQASLKSDGDWTILNLQERFYRAYEIKTPIFEDARDEGEFLRPEEFGEAEEKDIIQSSGPLAYAAQHIQAPQSRTGRMFDRGKVRIIQFWPVGTTFVRYWDTAASKSETACYTAGVLMGRDPDGRYIVADLKRGRWEPYERNRIMRNNGLLDMRLPGSQGYLSYSEKGAGDSGLERDALLIRYLAGIPHIINPAKGDKLQRAQPLSTQWEAGNVDLVIGEWNKTYLDDMELFPAGGRDTVDASSGAFNRLAIDAADFMPETGKYEDSALGQLPAYTFHNKIPRGHRQEEARDEFEGL